MRLYLLLSIALSAFFLSQNPTQAQSLSNPSQPDSKALVKFLNLNLLYCDPLSSETKQQHSVRLNKLIAQLNTLKPDLAAFQEVANCRLSGSAGWIETAKIIAEQTGLNYSFWQSEEVRDIWKEGIAFFWNPKTVRFDNIQCRHLGGAHYRGPMRIAKSLCQGDLHTDNGDVIRFYNTHLDVDAQYSLPQTREILGIIKQESHAVDSVIWAGDFNNLENTDAIRIIKEAGLNELARDRVDFIFGWNVRRPTCARTLGFVEEGISDHNALWLELR